MANLRLKFNKPDLKVYPLEEYSLEWVGKAEIYSASKLVNYLYVDISVLKNTDLVYVEYSKANTAGGYDSLTKALPLAVDGKSNINVYGQIPNVVTANTGTIRIALIVKRPFIVSGNTTYRVITTNYMTFNVFESGADIDFDGISQTNVDLLLEQINNITLANQGYSIFVKYSAYPDGTNFTETGIGKEYLGIARGLIAPKNKEDYEWVKIKGEQGIQGIQGDKGDEGAVALVYNEVVNITSGPAINYGIDLDEKKFNRPYRYLIDKYATVIVNYIVPNTASKTFQYYCTVKFGMSRTPGFAWGEMVAFVNITGDKGEKGDRGISSVTVGSLLVDNVTFTSDPQTQLNNKLDITGGEMSGRLTLSNRTNPTIAISASNFEYYIQQYQDILSLGSNFDKGVKIDSRGKATFPVVPYVNDKPIATKENVNTLSMCPSDNYIDNIFTFVNDGTTYIEDYFPPANGYVTLRYETTDHLPARVSMGCQFDKNANPIGLTCSTSPGDTGWSNTFQFSIPVPKSSATGNRIYVRFTAMDEDIRRIVSLTAKFIYAKEF